MSGINQNTNKTQTKAQEEVCTEKDNKWRKKKLPFTITLNEEGSNLYPVGDEKQIFTYTVKYTGPVSTDNVDLEFLILGICSNINWEDITCISVLINGVEQDIANKVKLKKEAIWGCTGLKFQYELKKNGSSGDMEISFELDTPYAVGEIDACLFGDGVKDTQTVLGPVCDGDTSYETYAYQNVTISAPIKITPNVEVGTPTAYACGGATVAKGGYNSCKARAGSSVFTITQTICLKVPVQFSADAEVISESIISGDVSTEDICTDCGEEKKYNKKDV